MSKDDDEYVAIGTFGIISNEKLNEYQKKLTEILVSDDFRVTFTKKMNDEIGNNTATARRLLDYNHFEAVTIEVIDPLNHTLTRDDNLSGVDSNNGGITIIIIVIVVSVVILVIIIGIIMVLRNKKRKINEKMGQTIEGFEGHHMEGNVEMEQANNNEEGIQDALTQNPPNDQREEVDDELIQNVINSDESLVNQINKTHNEEEMDADIIASVNQTLLGVDPVDNEQMDDYEMDIIAAINETNNGEIIDEKVIYIV